MNPLFQTFQTQESQQSNFQQQLSNLGRQIQQMGTTPELLGRMLIQNGRIPPERFEQYRQIANQLTGKNY